ncbi:MAG TPA: choice-of-anchor tandem repeat GloVer-containing protein [Terriglobia bacterium]|nr:choice-of-anchor tandem repeat GloVer-containing protein [Terriglobia bacterium]
MGKLNCVKRTFGLFLLCAMTAIALPAQTFTTLHTFDKTDGSEPFGGLIQAPDGALYGTTFRGGANLVYGAGTAFKITSNGTLTTLYSFCSQSGCTDGNGPQAALVQTTSRAFYGTTFEGGANGVGTVFKITPGGTLTALYSFCSQSGCPDGSGPVGTLVQAVNGNLYGTTSGGGDESCNPPSGCGTVFKITPAGTLTTLHCFDMTDGSQPVGELIQAADGNLYGTTLVGGANGQGGTVFKITPSGTLMTLYSFCSQSLCADGLGPEAGLIQATDGNFYGTTQQGGANNCSGVTGCGTVFKITPSGTLTTLYSFCSQSGCTDGQAPAAALAQATDGNLYGTTNGGGTNAHGTIFEITPSGTLTTLYSFCSLSGCTDGEEPNAPLVEDTNGNFYGTTLFGGANNLGTVFSLSVGLGPFVETQPTSGKVGRTVKILGTNLTGATSVSFNGTAATFTVVTRSLITTAVPAGATIGKVQVVTPSGTLSSNVPFRVLP